MSKNIFNSVKLSTPKKSRFDLTHDVKLTTDMGRLVPTLALECVPGDRFNIGCETLIRFAPMIAPVMHRFDVSVHYFFVPNRLLWANWEKFITTGEYGSTAPAAPYFVADAASTGLKTVASYMGVPTLTGGQTEQINAFPMAAYNRAYYDMYRDQNLQTGDFNMLEDGLNAIGNYNTLFNRAWEHDYFTSALPFAQKGNAVSLPLGTVNLQDAVVRQNFTSGAPNVVTGSLSSISIPRTPSSNTSIPSQGLYAATQQSATVSPTTVNDLRRAFKLQEWLERNARTGTRYIESILGHFGVRSSDKRLQRAEYITGIKSPVTVSEVLNTTGTATAAQGNMAGHAVAVAANQGKSYFCEEHGFIVGIMSVMPKTAYQDGLHRMFSKLDPLDYYWPSFANLGEQEIKNKEVYLKHSTPNGTFGYVPRYAEYKFQQSRVCGDFKTTLAHWHAARQFASDQNLNSSFVVSDPTTRIFAVTESVDHLYCHVLHKIDAVRPMPVFGTPGI